MPSKWLGRIDTSKKGLPKAYNLAENSGETVAGRIENLKPWPKGVSGNSGGRPKKKLITAELERLLEEEMPDSGGKTWAAAIAESLLRQALKGDVKAISELANRVEGKAIQAVNLDVNSSNICNMTEEELGLRMNELLEELQVETLKNGTI